MKTKPTSSAKKKAVKNDIFTIGSILPMTIKNNASKFLQAVEAMCEMGFRVIILAEGDTESQKLCFDLMQQYPGRFEVLESLAKNRKKIIESADVLGFSGCPSQEVKSLLVEKGIVPVLPEGCGFENYNAQTESGTGFTFESGNVWQMIAAVLRASENKKFAYDWKNLKRNIREMEIG